MLAKDSLFPVVSAGADLRLCVGLEHAGLPSARTQHGLAQHGSAQHVLQPLPRCSEQATNLSTELHGGRRTGTPGTSLEHSRGQPGPHIGSHIRGNFSEPCRRQSPANWGTSCKTTAFYLCFALPTCCYNCSAGQINGSLAVHKLRDNLEGQGESRVGQGTNRC